MNQKWHYGEYGVIFLPSFNVSLKTLAIFAMTIYNLYLLDPAEEGGVGGEGDRLSRQGHTHSHYTNNCQVSLMCFVCNVM